MPNASMTLTTLGCRLNAYESEVMKQHADSIGMRNVVVVNTCAVTGEAVRKSRKAVRRSHRENPDSTLIVTGCAAQIDPEGFADIDGVDLVVGNSRKLNLETWQNINADIQVETFESPSILVDDILTLTDLCGPLTGGFGSRSHAYVQIQNGCDHRCTFCIIPYGRGNSRSVPAGHIVDQIKFLVQKGYKEVVLTGVDLTSWGGDLPSQPKLGNLVLRILKLVPDLPRLRLSSIDPAEVDLELLEAFTSEPRLMPHIHLSIQAGDTLILKRMKRRHTRDDVLNICEALHSARKHIVLGADLIAGFPTETKAMFENTLKLIEECGLTWLHVFPFSPRPGTPAAKMPRVSHTEIQDRARRLRASGDMQKGKFFKNNIGTVHSVLVEAPDIGRAENYAEIRLTDTQNVGSILDVQITGLESGQMLGKTYFF